MTREIDWNKTRRPAPAAPVRLIGRVACAVCGLRADVLICKECALDPEASRQRVTTWLAGPLAQLGAERARLERALSLLEGL